MDLPKNLPKYAKMAGALDKKKILEISDEVMPVGVEFVKKLKEIARKYNKEYTAETSECLIATFLTSISSLVGDEQAVSILIEMLHKQHVFNAMKEAIPMEDAQKLITKLDSDFRKRAGKDAENSDEFSEFINEVVDKNTKKSDDRPDYLG